LHQKCGMLLDGQGPGGVRIVTTSSTGKTGATGCPFVSRCRAAADFARASQNEPRNSCRPKEGRRGGSRGQDDEKGTEHERHIYPPEGTANFGNPPSQGSFAATLGMKRAYANNCVGRVTEVTDALLSI
jgi:hypothetical protein